MQHLKIISFYISKQFLIAFGIVLSAIMGLVLLFDTIELMRRSASKEHIEFIDVISMAILKMPQMVHVILPFAVMIGAMVAFWKLTKNHELIIIRSVGVSVWQFLFPMIFVVFIIGVLNIAAFNPFASTMYLSYERMQDKLELRHENPLVFSEQGLWLREVRPDKDGNFINSIVHAENLHFENGKLMMENISIIETTIDNVFSRRIEAEKGVLDSGYYTTDPMGVFLLENAWEMTPGTPSVQKQAINIRTSLTLDKIEEKFASPETLSFWELPGFIDFFEASGFSALSHRLHFASLLISPIFLCSMVLVAAVFTIYPNQRKGGVFIRIVGCVTSGFILYFFSKLTYALGLSGALPVSLAATGPSVISILICSTILFHQEDG
jgi:lipopolysaccharide export system permease protein